MRIQVTNQPVLRAIQSVLNPMLRLGVSKKNVRVSNQAGADTLLAEMTAAGDRLMDALKLEHEFRRTDVMGTTAEALEQWRTCRRAVESLAQEYASSVRSWRVAVVEDARADRRAVLTQSLML